MSLAYKAGGASHANTLPAELPVKNHPHDRACRNDRTDGWARQPLRQLVWMVPCMRSWSWSGTEGRHLRQAPPKLHSAQGLNNTVPGNQTLDLTGTQKNNFIGGFLVDARHTIRNQAQLFRTIGIEIRCSNASCRVALMLFLIVKLGAMA